MSTEADLVNAMEAERSAVVDDIAGQIVRKLHSLAADNAELRAAVKQLRKVLAEVNATVLGQQAWLLYQYRDGNGWLADDVDAALASTAKYEEPRE